MARETEFGLRGDHITLDALLKAAGLAGSGGAAKQLVASGKVQVDGRMELRRGCKLRAGQVAAVGGTRIRLVAAAQITVGAVPADGGVLQSVVPTTTVPAASETPPDV